MLKASSADKYVLREVIKLGEGKVFVKTRAIADSLQIHQLTVNRALVRLESAGYLERCGRSLWKVLKNENAD